MTTLNDVLQNTIAEVTGKPFQIEGRTSIGGGCINQAWRLDGDGQSYFVKLNQADMVDMFAAESAGLAALAASASIRVPQPLSYGCLQEQAYLIMEYLPLGGPADPVRMGEQLAALHSVSQGSFGWHMDNTIGATHQANPQMQDWTAFYREHRLRFQYDLAARNGFGGKLCDDGERLMAGLEAFFSDYSPHPALLHGDLWSGNASYTSEGEPVIYDPACYCGDREADIAMTELFGGFDGRFYQAYRANLPLDGGYKVRRTLYNLYHILNHLNLFGGGYLRQAEAMTKQLLAEL